MQFGFCVMVSVWWFLGTGAVGTRADYARARNSLKLEVHWTSNLSEFPLRVAFVRALTESEIIGISDSFKA